jgi:phosphinothricin acetyltransferase
MSAPDVGNPNNGLDAMAATIRLARESDTPQMLSIYAPVVRETAISFELEPPAEDEFRRRVTDTLRRTPWLVCEERGDIAGYAYAGQYRARAAYQWSVEVSVYVSAAHRRRGVARALYASLFECLRVQGYYRAYAGISLPNAASVELHERLGFGSIGAYRSVGYKLGKWHDVGWWQLALRESGSSPSPPLPVQDMSDSPRWRRALESGAGLLRLPPG